MDIERRWRQLRARIDEKAGLLAQQGSLASRLAGRRRVWSLRFVDRTSADRPVQRSIYVGSDPELVHRTQDLLDDLRRSCRWTREATAFANIAAALHSL